MTEQDPSKSIDLSEESSLSRDMAAMSVPVCPTNCPNRASSCETRATKTEEKSKAGGIVASAIAFMLAIMMVSQVYHLKNGTIETRENPNLVFIFVCVVGAAVFAGVSIPSEVLALLPSKGNSH